jgi:hypothetical protein
VVSSLPLLEGGYWGRLCLCIFKLPGRWNEQELVSLHRILLI